MALARVKVWSAGDVLSAADLNAEFNNILNNGASLVSPWPSATLDLDGNTLVLDADADTSLDSATDDTIDLTISGADDFRFTANLFTLLSGSSLTIAAGDLTVTDGQTVVADPDARTTTVATPLTVRAETTGAAAAGIGTGILIQAESGDEAPSNFGQLEFAASDVGTGSEDTYFQVLLRVAGAALTSCYRFVATGAFNAIFTHANSAARTYTLPNYDGTLATVAGTETLTGKTFDAQGTGNSLTNVSTSALKTATASATADNVGVTVTMNDYTFSPSLTINPAAGTSSVTAITVADPSDTVGRFRHSYTGGNSGDIFTARWRYVTASDDPTVWVSYDPATGDIKATWCSDDPTLNDEPGVQVLGMTSKVFKAQALTGLAIAQQHLQEADARIAAKGLNPQHRLYRAMQVLANDDAPSGWLLANCKIQLAGERLVMK